MVMLPLPVHALSQGKRRISLILSKRAFSFSVPSTSAVPACGCGIADGFSTASGFSRDAPAGSVRVSAIAPRRSIAGSYDGLWEGAASFQLSLQLLFLSRGPPDLSGLEIPDALEILFSPKKSSFLLLFQKLILSLLIVSKRLITILKAELS